MSLKLDELRRALCDYCVERLGAYQKTVHVGEDKNRGVLLCEYCFGKVEMELEEQYCGLCLTPVFDETHILNLYSKTALLCGECFGRATGPSEIDEATKRGVREKQQLSCYQTGGVDTGAGE
jgi:hypothetical protein